MSKNKSKKKNNNANKVKSVKLKNLKINTSKDDNNIYFAPLGGVNQIGENMYLYGYKGEWIIVDCGLIFASDHTPGIDILVPDTKFLETIKNNIKGIFLTHAHEDHYGAIPFIWEKLGCPVYGTQFALGMLENKLKFFDKYKEVFRSGKKNKNQVKIPMKQVNEKGARFKVGNFDIEFMHFTHSMPEANGIVIRTEQGAILHTGDWKFDTDPVVGEKSDMNALKELSKEKVLAIFSDSTNAGIKGRTFTENVVKEELTKTISNIKGNGKVIITSFSTSIGRMQSIAHAAKATGRKIAVGGLSIWRNSKLAQECGYLEDVEFMELSEAEKIPDDQLLYLVTGTQGEPRAVMSRVAEGAYKQLRVREGDTVIFSSLLIPRNEDSVLRVYNNLSSKGVNVITKFDNPKIHTSGHAYRDEIIELYKMLKPKYVIPVHGEAMHLFRNKQIAQEMKINSLIVDNGNVLCFKKGKNPFISGLIPIGETAIDGKREISAEDDIFRVRRKINYNGSMFITLVMDKKGKLKEKAKISSLGIFETDPSGDIVLMIRNAIKNTLSKLSKNEAADDSFVKEMIIRVARKTLRDNFDKNPPTVVHLIRK